MIWVLAAVLALVSFLAIALVLKAPKSAWAAVGTALLLGLAGYALQASPGLSGAPKAPQQDATNEAAAMVEARKALAGHKIEAGNQWVVIGDALARHGQFADAAGVYRGAVEKDPRNAEAWLALANVLVAHADENLTPAALLAYRRAQDAAPDNPAPPFFLGLALVQSGRLGEARSIWAGLLEATPPDAPWRDDLTQRLARLDAVIKGRPPR